jgi:hypothetical protein
MSRDINFDIGLTVYKGDWDGAKWTITGLAKPKYTVIEFDGAYEFEELIQAKIPCKGIEFDSEYCQFFAYAKTKQSALAFVKRIEKHFAKVRNLLNVKL